MNNNEAIEHMVRKLVHDRAAMPPVVTAVKVRITNPGLRFRMAAYDATHCPARGVLADERY
jgi:hypothetical protein